MAPVKFGRALRRTPWGLLRSQSIIVIIKFIWQCFICLLVISHIIADYIHLLISHWISSLFIFFNLSTYLFYPIIAKYMDLIFNFYVCLWDLLFLMFLLIPFTYNLFEICLSIILTVIWKTNANTISWSAAIDLWQVS